MINSAVDYDAHFPAGYDAGHTAGLRLLRVAARARAEHGRDAVGALYAALGARIFDAARRAGPRRRRVPRHPRVRRAGPGRRRAAGRLADALDDDSRDAEIRARVRRGAAR